MDSWGDILEYIETRILRRYGLLFVALLGIFF